MPITLDFKTTHNIVINYSLASVLERIIAFFIDSMILYFTILILFFVFKGTILYYFLSIVLFSFYTLISEYFMAGQTIGKKIMKIKVVSLSGQIPTLSSYFIRWAFRFIDIFMTIGTLAILSMLSSIKSQRIGDLLANTTVIKVSKNRKVELSTLENLGNVKLDFEYPDIVKFTDDEMLLVKQVIKRFSTYPTEANHYAMELICEKIEKTLGIEVNEKNKIDFLKQVLNEYIVLTR